MSDDLDDSLPIHKKAFVRSHVLVCPPCRKVHAQLHDTVALLRELRDAPPTDDGPAGDGEG